jgi:hypothetical protein
MGMPALVYRWYFGAHSKIDTAGECRFGASHTSQNLDSLQHLQQLLAAIDVEGRARGERRPPVPPMKSRVPAGRRGAPWSKSNSDSGA